MKLKIKKDKKRGFTLVELVVTIAIMLAIVTIAVPSAINLSNKSKKKSHDLQIKEFLSAAESYVLDNKNKWNVDSILGSSRDNYCITLDELEEKNYIKEIPDDPTTKNEKFSGSITVRVNSGKSKLEYEYTTDACTNKLAESGLEQKLDYDEYLNINVDSTSGNTVSNVPVSSALEKVGTSRNYSLSSFMYNIEPGIECNGLSVDDSNAYCSFVGPVENNYIQISGIKYPADTDYNGQSNETISWRIISFDNSNETIRLIPDLNIYNSKFNDYSDNASISNISEAVESTKLSNYKYNVEQIGNQTVSTPNVSNGRLLYKDIYSFIDRMTTGRELSSTTYMYPLTTLEGDYKNINETSAFKSELLDNSHIYSKTSGLFLGKVNKKSSLNSSSTSYITLPENNISYYVVVNNDNQYSYECGTCDSCCSTVSSKRIISIKRVADQYFLTMIESKYDNTKKVSYVLDSLNNWFNPYKNLTQDGNPIFKQTSFCASNWADNGSFNLVSSNDYTAYSNLEYDIDTIKNCTYPTYSYDNKNLINNEKITGNVGLLSVAEFIRMGGYVVDPGSHGLYGMSKSNLGLYQNNTMFKYNISGFWTSDVSELERENSYSGSGRFYYSGMFYIMNIAQSSGADNNSGLRPVITLNKNIKIKSGSGTRLDPWIIDVD